MLIESETPSRKIRHEKALIGAYEPIPITAINDVVINTVMKENIVDPNLTVWLDKDYLLKNAAIFGFGREVGTITALQTPTSHRVALLAKDEFFTDELGN